MTETVEIGETVPDGDGEVEFIEATIDYDEGSDTVRLGTEVETTDGYSWPGEKRWHVVAGGRSRASAIAGSGNNVRREHVYDNPGIGVGPREVRLRYGDDAGGVSLTGDIGPDIRRAFREADESGQSEGEAEFVVDGVEALSELDPGESYTVVVSVGNEGGVAGDAEVSLDVDGSDSVEVGPGDVEDVIFDGLEAPDSGSGFTIEASTQDDSQSVDIRLSEPEPEPASDFVIEDLSMPSDLSPGDSYTLRVTVSNVGDAAGSTDVSVHGAGSQSISLEPGQEGDVSFLSPLDFDAGHSGSVTVSTDDDEDSVDVEVSDDSSPNWSVGCWDAPEVTSGEEFTVAPEITNTGDGDGTVELIIGGESFGEYYIPSGNSIEPDVTPTAPDTSDSGVVTEEVIVEVVDVDDSDLSTTITCEIDVAPGAFFLVSLSVPPELTPGDTYTANATVSNVGTDSGEGEVSIEGAGSETFELSVGESDNILFTSPIPATDPGELSVTATTGDDEDTVTISVSPDSDPELSVSCWDTPEVTSGEEFTVAPEVDNSGGDVTVELIIGGESFGEYYIPSGNSIEPDVTPTAPELDFGGEVVFEPLEVEVVDVDNSDISASVECGVDVAPLDGPDMVIDDIDYPSEIGEDQYE